MYGSGINSRAVKKFLKSRLIMKYAALELAPKEQVFEG